MKILIVDDLKSARKILRKLLSSIGYEDVVEADNGEEAYEKIAQDSFDLVISDWEMPKMNGIELLKKVRLGEKTQNMPFIMITSNTSKVSIMEAAEFKVSDYIAKPFDQKLLTDKINKALGVQIGL